MVTLETINTVMKRSISRNKSVLASLAAIIVGVIGVGNFAKGLNYNFQATEAENSNQIIQMQEFRNKASASNSCGAYCGLAMLGLIGCARYLENRERERGYR